MTTRPIIDAGPSLNFLSINKERLLIATMGKLSAPESVLTEVLHKAAQGYALPRRGVGLAKADADLHRGPVRRPDRGALPGRQPDRQPARWPAP